MRIVLDANQAQPARIKQVVRDWRPDCMVLPPLVLAEILLREDPLPTLRALQGTRVMYGIETEPLMERLALLTAPKVRHFVPLARPEDVGIRHPGDLTVDPGLIRLAREIKAGNRAWVSNTVVNRAGMRAWLDAQGTRLRFCSLAEAEVTLGRDEESFLQTMVVDAVANRGRRDVRIADRRMRFRAVMRNPFLRSFFRAVFAYHLAISGMLDQRPFRGVAADFPPGPGEDWTDLTLFLYAADGDILMTADRRVRSIARLIGSSDAIRFWPAVAA